MLLSLLVTSTFFPFACIRFLNHDNEYVLLFYDTCHLRMLCKWNCTIWKLWDWLFSFSIFPWRFILVVACINNLFCLWLGSIPWYGYTIICLTVYPLCLNYLHVLAIMKKVAVIIHGEIFV